MADRFDLEQQILECWKVIEDIELLYENLESMDDDERMNYLLGLQSMYKLKFNRVWATFEQLVNDKKIT